MATSTFTFGYFWLKRSMACFTAVSCASLPKAISLRLAEISSAEAAQALRARLEATRSPVRKAFIFNLPDALHSHHPEDANFVIRRAHSDLNAVRRQARPTPPARDPCSDRADGQRCRWRAVRSRRARRRRGRGSRREPPARPRASDGQVESVGIPAGMRM